MGAIEWERIDEASDIHLHTGIHTRRAICNRRRAQSYLPGAGRVSVWILPTREERNRFVEDTAGMSKAEREAVFERRIVHGS